MAYYKEIDFEDLTDEEIDEYYRPKKQNSRKTLAPLFVYRILQEESTPEKYLTQAKILKRLEERFELTLERKALSRMLHNLQDEGLGIGSHPKEGFFCDPDTVWAA